MAGELAECIMKGRQPRATLKDGFCSAIICFAIDQAMEEGRVVELDSFWEQAVI